MQKTAISIIIPCRNEENFIENCIQSVQEFLIPDNTEIEILIIEGKSIDNTRNILETLIKKDSRIMLIENPNIFQSFALNIGLKKARGEFIMRLDAHTIYPKNYLYDLHETIVKTNSDNCGGQLITKPNGNTYGSAIVQAITTHPFGVGNSGFRTGLKQGEVDTVPFGYFKKGIFNKIGIFDERLTRAQDYEFNSRIIKNGGKIWLNPTVVATYYNQNTLYKFYKKQMLIEAPYNAYMWYLAPYTFTYRHAITGVFVIGLIGGFLLYPFILFTRYIFFSVLVLYFVLATISAFQQAIRYNNPLHIFVLPICFFLYHILHGLGLLGGLLCLVTGTSPVQSHSNKPKLY